MDVRIAFTEYMRVRLASVALFWSSATPFHGSRSVAQFTSFQKAKMSKILPQEPDDKPPSTMKAAHITEWCDVGTVPDSIVLGEVPAPPPPLKREVVIGVRATAINVDDVAGLQDTAMGGVCIHLPAPKEGRPLVGGCEYAGVVLATGPDCKRLKGLCT